MGTLKEKIALYKEKIIKNKKILYPFIGIITLIILIGIYSFFGFVSKRLEIPQVSGANFSIEYRKIPFDSKTVEVSFSTNLKQESINQKTIVVSPFVEGNVELKGGNTIIYNLKSNLEIGQEYSLTISKDTKSEHGVSLKKDYNIIFEAISGAKVTKIIPENTLENISQNLIVLFNIPLIPLTSLSNKDKLPCPVEISPKINGKCKWTGGNALEFIPEKHWEGATEYKITVNSSSGLLYPLKEKKEITFKTPKLEFYTDSNFSPKYGIFLRSNFAVDSKQIENNINVTNNNQKIDAIIEKQEGSDTRFIIKPKNGSFSYGKSYNLSIPAGINPKNGNIKTDSIYNTGIISNNFLLSKEIYANKLSETGAIIDTINYTDFSSVPNKNIFWKLTFDDEISLEKNQFSITNSKGKTFDFDIKYGTEQEWKNGKFEEKESKKILILKLKENLAYNTKYSLTILKKSNKALEQNENYDFTTVNEFKVTGLEYITNTLACVYFSNDIEGQRDGYYSLSLEDDKNQKLITTTPTSPVRGIGKDREDYQTKTYKCIQKPGQKSYLLNIRLNPFTAYEIKIPSNFRDDYGNELKKEYKFNVKSFDIKEEDKYIYSSFSKVSNVIPTGEPNIINIQSINLENITVQVCEMDIKGYDDFTRNNYKDYFTPQCIETVSKELKLKNKFWEISNNRFDIEKDIFGKKIESPVYLVRAAIGNKYLYYPNNGKDFGNIIIRSNLSLTLESAANKKLIFATSLDGKETPSDLYFKGYKINNGNLSEGVIMEVKWIKEKNVYEIKSGENYDIIVARNNKYYSVINQNTDQTSNYDFKYVSGQDASNKDYLYLYTERPIYKPGDTVFFKGILRYFNFDGYKKSNVSRGKLKILDENYQFFKEVDITVDKNSNFSGKFELPKDMKLGRYNFEFYPDGSQISVYNDGQFFVEEYKKPTFKINIDSPKKDYVLGEKVSLNFDSEYYFGGKMTGANYFKSILTQNYFFDAKDYSNYSFGNGYDIYECLYWGYCNYGDETVFSEEGKMNADGKEKWDYNLPKEEKDSNKNPTGEKIYNFNISIEDPDTKKQVNKTQSIVLHNTDAYVGINSSYYNTKENGIKINGIILNHSAQPLSGKEVKIELIKREWKNVKKEGVDGIFYNDYSVEEKNEQTLNYSSDSKGEFSDTLNIKTEGEYEIRAIYTGENGKSFISSNYTYVAGEEAVYWNNGNNTTTDLIADKNILKIGDTAGFTLKSPVKSGKIFVTIEKDDGILDYFTQDIKSTGERISIKVKEDYYPNFYVKVFLVGKDGNNPLPVYKRALSVIKTVTDYKKIKVSVKPEKNHYLPQDKVKLEIRTTDENGKAVPFANGSLSLVDESLLALKGNPKKNPYAFFYDMKRYLAVETYLSLFNLVEKLEVKDISDGEKGGAGEGQKGGNAKKKRGIFKDTAYWQADFTTDKNGIAKITTEPLPDNLTTWVIESVVSTSDDTKIGVGENTIITTKKVIINENTPRFLGSNDTITFSPVVFNKTGKNSTFKISAIGENIKITNPTQEIKINNGEQKTLNFSAKVIDLGVSKNDNPVGKITLKAVSIETGDQDEIEKFLQINETSTLETVATVGKTDSNSYTEKIDLTNVIIDSAKLIIRYSPTILSNLTSGIEYLKNYPYGCLEQRKSAIMPNVYIKKLYNSANLPFDLTKKMIKVWVDNETGYKEISVDETIKNYIAESLQFQKYSGGFTYWTNDYSDANFHLTSIIIDSMAEMKNIGYSLNDSNIKKAISYLKTRFYANVIEGCTNPNEYNNFCKYTESERLDAILSILHINHDDYESYKMYKLLNTDNKEIGTLIKKLNVIARLFNNKSLAKTDKETLKKTGIELGNKIIKEYVVYNPRGAFLGKDSHNSRLINTANFIGTLSEFGLENFEDVSQILDNMNRWIISEKKEGSFGSTEETSSVINNLSKYILASGELKDIKANIKAILNTEVISETNVDEKNKLEVFEKIITGKEKLKTQNDFTISKTGNSKIYYDLALSYYLPSEKIEPRDEGFYLENTYYDYNEYRKIETLKNEEWTKYINGEIDFDNLKYSKNIVEYIKPVNEMKVGQLIVVYNKIVTPEPRDQVAFEGFIPSGSELVNTNLATENSSMKFTSIFDREEFRDERYFGFLYSMNPGVYEFNYVIRITHNGTFNIKPSKISEFYKSEVFGRNGGKMLKIGK